MENYTSKMTLSAKRNKSFKSIQITSSLIADTFARQFYKDDILIYESCFMMMLNRQLDVIAWAKISQGGIAATCMDPAIVAKFAIESLASGVILVHNHPSGNLHPSQQDKDVTKRIKETLKLFDCQLTDHLILSDKGFISFSDEGLL